MQIIKIHLGIGVCRASASVGGTSDIEGWLFITEVCPVGGGRAEAA